MDLTSLTAVKGWLNVKSFDDDALLSSLISQVSGVILSYLSRPDILKRQWMDQFSATGQSARMLRNYPVISVASATSCGQAIPSTSFWIEPDDGVPPGRMQMVNLTSGTLQGLCQIVYTAGYCTTETHTGLNATVSALYGSWTRDEGVTYVNGTTLAKVTGAPSAGQYALGKIPGQYVLGENVPVLISYSYVPADLERACVDIVAERYKYKERIGQASKNISGEVISFSLSDMPNFTKLSLQPFKRPPVPV
jgi:hypothetical protein